jgi:hypothetical protein
MLGDIYVQRRNNFVRGFSGHEEIIDWLREQWAGLFADSLKKRQGDLKLKNLENQISELSNLVNSLKTYSEEIVKIVNKDKSHAIIKKVNKQFRKRQVQKFMQESLITFMGADFAQAKKKMPPAEEVFDKFLESKSLRGFANAIGYPDVELIDFKEAKEDYKNMKLQYTKEGVEEDSAAE